MIEEKEQETSTEKNSVAKGMQIIGGIAVFAGFIVLVVYFSKANNSYGSEGFYRMIGVASLVSGIMAGGLFFGLSEIITLLDKIKSP